MNLDYLEQEDGGLEPSPGRREKVRIRTRDDTEFRGRKDRRSPREQIRKIRKTHTRF